MAKHERIKKKFINYYLIFWQILSEIIAQLATYWASLLEWISIVAPPIRARLHALRLKRQDDLRLLKAFIGNPNMMGSAVPSSRYLSRAMARLIDLPLEGIVVELGAGTGVITNALLVHGVSASQMLVVELDNKFSELLRQRFPNVKVLQGDAANLQAICDAEFSSIPLQYVVSSLPLLSIPKPVANQVVQAIYQTLTGDGKYIQFTYKLYGWQAEIPQNFECVESHIVWRNLPPARVNVFCKKKPA